MELHDQVGERFVVLVVQRGEESLISPDLDVQDGDVLAVLGDAGEVGSLLALLDPEA